MSTNWLIPNGVGIASLLDLIVSKPVNSLLGGLASISIASGGSNYVLNDVVTVAGGTLLTGAAAATIQVTGIDGSGAVVAFSILSYGGWSVNPATPNSPTGGTGTGLSLNLVFATPINRAEKVVQMAVNRIRGAISTGNRTPLSETPYSIPPELEAECYALALELLLPSNPALAQYAINPPGTGKSAMATCIANANECIKELQKGEPVTYPEDPETSDASGSTVADGGGSGEVLGDVDLTTDGPPNNIYAPPLPVGNVRYSGTQNPNGFQVANVGDQYFLYDSNSELQFVYVKQGTSGNSANWMQAIV